MKNRGPKTLFVRRRKSHLLNWIEIDFKLAGNECLSGSYFPTYHCDRDLSSRCYFSLCLRAMSYRAELAI